jgi:hypothetical protein
MQKKKQKQLKSHHYNRQKFSLKEKILHRHCLWWFLVGQNHIHRIAVKTSLFAGQYRQKGRLKYSVSIRLPLKQADVRLASPETAF